MTIKQFYPTQGPVLNLNYISNQKIDQRITFTRASTATYVDSGGLIQTAAANEARIDHDPVTGASLGLLLEESRTNNTNNSEVLTDTGGGVGAWTANATTAPDGNSTADLWIPVSGFVDRNAATLSNSINGNNSVLTASVFVKKKELRYAHIAFLSSATYYTRLFDLDTGEFVKEYSFGSPTQTSSTVTALPNGWYRLSVSKYVSNTETTARLQVGSTDVSNPSHPYGQVTYVADGTSGMYFWGAQLEQGAFPTSYIPTSGSTVTRAADAASITGTNFSSWYNSSAGTVFTKFKSQYPDGEPTTIFEGQARSTIRIFAFTNYNRVQFQYGSTGVYSNDGASGYPTESDFSSAALFYTDDGTNSSFGGSYQGFPVKSGTGTGGVTISSFIFAPFTGASGALQASSAHLSRFTYYPTRLPDATLQALTL